MQLGHQDLRVHVIVMIGTNMVRLLSLTLKCPSQVQTATIALLYCVGMYI